jgi:hypothetical protein
MAGLKHLTTQHQRSKSEPVVNGHKAHATQSPMKDILYAHESDDKLTFLLSTFVAYIPSISHQAH